MQFSKSCCRLRMSHHSDWAPLPREEIELGAPRRHFPGGTPNPIDTSMVLTPLALGCSSRRRAAELRVLASFRMGPLGNGGIRTWRAAIVRLGPCQGEESEVGAPPA